MADVAIDAMQVAQEIADLARERGLTVGEFCDELREHGYLSRVPAIQRINPVPYVWGKSYPEGTTVRIEVDPSAASCTHGSCNWASGVPVEYMEVFVWDVPEGQPLCTHCGGGR